MRVFHYQRIFVFILMLRTWCAAPRTPAEGQDCSQYDNALHDCFRTQEITDYEGCGDCFDEYMNFDETSCQMLEFSICASVHYCSTCEPCLHQYAAYHNCTYPNCSINCTDIPAPCSYEWGNLEFSLSEYGMFEDALLYAISFQCYRNTSLMMIDTTSCATANSSICTAITKCGGGDVVMDAAESYFKCKGIQDDRGQNCVIDCKTNLTQWQNRSDECQHELDILNVCLYSALDESHVLEYKDCFDDTCCIRETSCENLANGFCLRLSNCNCGPCQSAVETYFGCQLEHATGGICQFENCSTVLPPSPPQEDAGICAVKENSMMQCLQMELDDDSLIQACTDCVNNNNITMTLNASSCESLVASVCENVLTCPCPSSCQSEVASHVICDLWWGIHELCRATPIDCLQQTTSQPPSNTTSTPSQGELCDQEENAIYDCFSTKMHLEEAGYCQGCMPDLNIYFDQFEPSSNRVWCIDLEDAICQYVAGCSCDRCRSEMETFLDCIVNSTTNGKCGIHCDEPRETNEDVTVVGPSGDTRRKYFVNMVGSICLVVALFASMLLH